MYSRRTRAFVIALAITTVLLSACGTGGVSSRTTPAPSANRTGIQDLDVIVAAAVSGEPRALLPYLEFASLPCTTAPGLGGPPKCLPAERDGTPVNVLPFLGPGEGSFVRESDAPNWVGPRLLSLYAAYDVSAAAYSDSNYPAGEVALVFATDGAPPSPVTLQVSHGRIVRIDYGAGWPPRIRSEAVNQYLVFPP